MEVEDVVRKQFGCECLYLEEFVVKGNSVEGYLVTTHGKYVGADFSAVGDSNDSESDESRIMVKSIGDSSLSIPL